MATVNPRKAILSVQDLVKSFGSQPVLEGLSLTVHEGDRIGLIGQNGSGKSTLIRIMAGQEVADDGLVTFAKGLRVGLLSQQCTIDTTLTVGQVIDNATRTLAGELHEYHALMDELAQAAPESPEHTRIANRIADLQHHLDLANVWDIPQDVKRISVALNLPDQDRLVESLSGGELRRLDLAATILSRPDLLLLDEPTNHIDTTSVEWIESFLSGYSGSCILVTHDRYFLDRVVNRIVELERSRLIGFPGNYARFLEYKAALIEQETREEDRRQAFLRRELEWIKRGPKARGTKQKARKERFYDVAEQRLAPREKEFLFEIPDTTPLSKRVLEVEALVITRGGRTLVKGFSLAMQKYMRVGIVGPNGSGKTTLLKVLMGQEPPDAGTVFIGENTRFLYVDQHHEELDPEKTILQNVSNGLRYWEIGNRRMFVPSYLEKFLFDIRTVDMPMGHLSGGERNRLGLAKQMLQGGNFLVFDEPTNDLDLYTLRVIEETVNAFDGCALLVSHDRYFLNRVCTHLLVFEGDGNVVLITGDYDDYLLYRERKAEADKPAPVKTEKPRNTENAIRSRNPWKEKVRQENLAKLMQEVDDAEAAVARIQAKMAEPGFYQGEYAEVQKTVEALRAAEARVSERLAEWEALEASGTADA